MVIPVETEEIVGNQAEALAQLTLWAMSLFRRLRCLSDEETSFPLPIPMLLVMGDQWFLYFAIDGSENTKVLDFGEIGYTSNIQHVYRLLASLKALFQFVQDLWVPEYRKKVLL